MTTIELSQRQAYIENLRADLRYLTPAWLRDAQLEPAGHQAVVVRDADGHPLAKFRHSTDAYFLARAAHVIEDLLDTLEDARDDLREARTVRRSYAVLTNHLLMAQRAGFTSREGQRRIRDAHAEALDPTPNKPWDW